ncbi:hypothetical protein LVJ94_09535 [Pendulispora rubella]|uniref:Uncharacterized protein n=1 Tax=Pendulispora rubella TaxID=2741070 RepID=A0ABZ2L9M7_9BACT
MPQAADMAIVERLEQCLSTLEQMPDMPRYDIAWLRLRCRDTLQYHHELQRASLRQLQRDVSKFVEAFPNVLPASLVEEVAQTMP